MKTHRLFPLWCWLCLLPVFANAQSDLFDFGFTRNPHITVIHPSDTLLQPWTGGMNSIFFSPIDLDLDNYPDLVGFEKHGNRILPFLWQNGQYIHAPQYAHCFPDLHDWAILKDYDGDGKSDIFTYGLAGIRIFHNTSTDTLSFELVTEQLPAWYYNGYVNLYASPDDYLVVDDIDGDGLIDILNFWVLGKYVHYLRNYADSPGLFDMRLEESCWGHFSEADDNNTITLFTDCDAKSDDEPLRHNGSSMLRIDIDGDSIQDLLVGDVDSPHLIYLHNGGTNSDASMDSQDSLFPSNAPVVLYSMPAPAQVQIPGQAHPSLIISPSDPSLAKSQDLQSVWRYDYDTLLHQYTLVQKDFLQKEMIDIGSGCRPVLHDWDGDGLTDLFLANYGQFDSASVVNGFLVSDFSSSIHYYHNEGSTTQPAFRLADTDFGHLRDLNLQALHPTFGDLNDDGLTDMLCGNKEGTLILVPHQRITTGSGDIETNYRGISTDGFSTPQLFDLDNDGRSDLLIGNRRGLISYHHNIGICGMTDFEHVTDTLGQVDVRDFNQSYFGHSVPCFFRDSQLGTVLFCGCESGHIRYYSNIDGNLNGAFTLSEYTLAETVNGQPLRLREGIRTGVAVGMLYGDNMPDMIVGNYAGGVSFFSGSEQMHHGTGIANIHETQYQTYPNPTTGMIFCTSSAPQDPIQTMEIFDLSGRCLLQSGSDHLDLSALANGLYILIINHHSRHKIIKQ
ncbi:MAG: T9SS type A sorting domain-containing protein [Bacteroidales bacterium]|nr:T9SS type A sorting domain-containing protein [Bacteroidales bacterium]